jgi:hypothetical protein
MGVQDEGTNIFGVLWDCTTDGNFLLCPCMAEGVNELPWVSFHKSINLIHDSGALKALFTSPKSHPSPSSS